MNRFQHEIVLPRGKIATDTLKAGGRVNIKRQQRKKEGGGRLKTRVTKAPGNMAFPPRGDRAEGRTPGQTFHEERQRCEGGFRQERKVKEGVR